MTDIAEHLTDVYNAYTRLRNVCVQHRMNGQSYEARTILELESLAAELRKYADVLSQREVK